MEVNLPSSKHPAKVSQEATSVVSSSKAEYGRLCIPHNRQKELNADQYALQLPNKAKKSAKTTSNLGNLLSQFPKGNPRYSFDATRLK